MNQHFISALSPILSSRTAIKFARWSLAGFALLFVGLTALGAVWLPDYAARHYLEYTPNAFWTSAQTQAALGQIGWSPMSMAWFLLVNELVVTLFSGLFILFLFWRKSNDWFGLYLIFTLTVTFSGGSILAPVIERFPTLAWIYDLMGSFGWQLYFILFYFFPDGRFIPRWTRWLLLAWLAANVFNALGAWWLGMALVASTVISQVYRYFCHSTPIQKQQTKWVVATLAILIIFLGTIGPRIFQVPPEDALAATLRFTLIFTPIFRMSTLIILASILVAVLRYRLWDIDIIIRRTLIYGLLTALLTLFYLGSVVVLDQLFRGLTGQASSLAIILSTLASAVLFTPLRRRVQSLIDQRFFRSKYDAQNILASFGDNVRDEVELQRLSGALLSVAEETMQPERAVLWLKNKKASIHVDQTGMQK